MCSDVCVKIDPPSAPFLHQSTKQEKNKLEMISHLSRTRANCRDSFSNPCIGCFPSIFIKKKTFLFSSTGHARVAVETQQAIFFSHQNINTRGTRATEPVLCLCFAWNVPASLLPACPSPPPALSPNNKTLFFTAVYCVPHSELALASRIRCLVAACLFCR